ncbi:MAG TPA: hypothetical protein VKR22_08830 [Acidimicrobiales bacterium]|nr:hypothetical protein [Acidimicrobiales bacterium]
MTEAGAFLCPRCDSSTEGQTLRLDPAQRPIGSRDRDLAITLKHFVRSAHVKSPLFVAFAFCVVFSVLAFALGIWLIGLFLGALAFALAVLWAGVVWDDLEPRVQATTLKTADAVWRSARVVRVSLASWSRAGKVEVQMRAKQHLLARQRELLFRTLGEAVFNGNEELTEGLKQSITENNALIEQNDLERRLAWESAGERVGGERSATAPTQMFETAEHAESGTNTYW